MFLAALKQGCSNPGSKPKGPSSITSKLENSSFLKSHFESRKEVCTRGWIETAVGSRRPVFPETRRWLSWVYLRCHGALPIGTAVADLVGEQPRTLGGRRRVTARVASLYRLERAGRPRCSRKRPAASSHAALRGQGGGRGTPCPCRMHRAHASSRLLLV